MKSYVRYITILGVTDYDRTRYSWPTEEGESGLSPSTVFPIFASVALTRKSGSLVVSGTKKALDEPPYGQEFNQREKIDREYRRLRDTHPCSIPELSLRFEYLPDGHKADHARDTVAKLVEFLSEEQLLFEVGLGETGRGPEQIVLDVTTGYRIQPMAAVAAANTKRAEWRRRSVSSSPAIHVYYAQFDPHSATDYREDPAREYFSKRKPSPPTAPMYVDEIVRVGNLQNLAELELSERWNEGIAAFLRFGRADDLAELAVEQGLPELGRRLRDLADALCTAQIPKVISELAPATVAELDRATSMLVRSNAPAASVRFVREIRAELEKIALEAPFLVSSQAGFEKSQALLDWYLRLGRYSEVISATNELMVLLSALTLGGSTWPEPGSAGFDEWWGSYTKKRLKALNKLVDHGVVANAVDFDRALRDERNPVAHAGFREEIKTPDVIRQRITEIAKQFSSLSVPVTPEAVALEQRSSAVEILYLGVPSAHSEYFRDVDRDRVVEFRKAIETAKSKDEWNSAYTLIKETHELAPQLVRVWTPFTVGTSMVVAALQKSEIMVETWRPKGKFRSNANAPIDGDWQPAPDFQILLA
jgi:hypothetical protein